MMQDNKHERHENREKREEREEMEYLKHQQEDGKNIRGHGPHGNMLKEKPKDMKGTLKRLIKYIGKSKYLVIGLIAASLITTLLGLVAPILQGNAIDAVQYEVTEEDTELYNDTTYTHRTTEKEVTNDDGSITTENVETIFYYERMLDMIVLLALSYFASAGITYFSGLFSVKLSVKTVYDLRSDLFANMSYLTIGFTDRHKHGDLMSRMTNDASNISNAISSSLSSLIGGIISLIGTFAIMFFYSWQLTLVAIAVIPISLIVSALMSKLMRKYFVRQQKILGAINGHIEEMVTGYDTVVAYGHEKESTEKFRVLSEDLKKTGIKANIFGSIMGPIMNAVGNITFLAVAVVGGIFAAKDMISIGTILMFVQYSKNITRPINEIANQYSSFITAIAGAERVFEVMDAVKESDEKGTDIVPSEIRGDLDFNNVVFSYIPEKPVLTDFDLHVKSGQTIAIVGRTGSGKTTVVNLLNRFYEINGGSILLDGKNIADISKPTLRSTVSIVLQDTVLFTDTIANNIRYGRLDATDEEVRAAAHTANADVFIERLPDGYNTVLTDSGSNLSQGQRQLISIARAVLADKKILILDEATSSVDTRTEMQIQSALIELMKNRTSLVIAHRLSTIRNADKIIVLSDGHISEAGNHEELLAKHGVYYNLYMTQFSGMAT